MPAFPTLTAGFKRILKDWGSLRSAASTHLTASQVWQALKEVGTTAYYAEAGGTWNQFQKLYGLARRNQVAAELFAAANGTEAFDRNWAGITPHARTYAAREAAPSYMVRVNFTTVDLAGNIVNTWATVEIQARTISTKDSIIAQATTEIAGLISTPKHTGSGGYGTLASVNTVFLTLW